MNKLLYTLIFTVILLSSCKTEVTDHHYYYYKCFFLGETSFLIEGETFKLMQESSSGQPLTEPIPFDSLVARISNNPGPSNYLTESDYYTEWEIPAIKLTESKFQLPVDITSNGITIDKDIITKNVFNRLTLFYHHYTNSHGNSSSFPAFELKFFFNGRYEHNTNTYPIFREDVEKNEYYLYRYTYMYIAEPIDISRTYINEPIGSNYIEKHYYDFNFSKSGWYKIIERYYREIGDDPTGENTYFIPPEREETSQ